MASFLDARSLAHMEGTSAALRQAVRQKSVWNRALLRDFTGSFRASLAALGCAPPPASSRPRVPVSINIFRVMRRRPGTGDDPKRAYGAR